jgi:hypothetical protein
MKCYIITTCTSKKKYPSNINLKDVINKSTSIDNLYNNWEQLQNSNQEKYNLEELYAGVQWSNILKAKELLSNKYATELLVMSAGFGLIHSDNTIPSYNITFSKDNENSIHNIENRQENLNQKWWNLVNKFDINTLDKDACIFIIGSQSYLQSAKNTIEELITIYGKKLFIISSGVDYSTCEFKDNLLQFSTKFNSINKGTFISINQRAFHWLSEKIIINNLPLEKSTLNKLINDTLKDIEPFKQKQINKLSEFQLVNFIKKQIIKHNKTSATQGLKHLRLSGYSCEQKRYNKLFNETLKSVRQ